MNAADTSDKISNDLEIDQAFRPSNCRSQKRNEEEIQGLERRAENLAIYQNLKVGDWVAKGRKIGEIADLNLSDEGIPIAWVKWVSAASGKQCLVAEQPNSLKLLGDNWNENWKLGERSIQGTIVGYAWCKAKNSPQAIVEIAGIKSCIDIEFLEKPSANPSNISPSKKRRRKGLGTGYLFCKPIVRNNKEYPQWWYQWEEKKEGKWIKRTVFVSKKVLTDVQLLESQKAPVNLILKTIGVY